MDQRKPPPFVLLPPPAASVGGVCRWPPSDPSLRGRTAHLVKCVAKGTDAADLVNAWPAQLITMVEIAEAAIRAALPPPFEKWLVLGFDPAALARAVVAAQAEVVGGGRIHFPTAERVARLLRDAKIWREFDGRNVKPLAAKYRLDEYTIYRIIKRQRDLRRKARSDRAARPT